MEELRNINNKKTLGVADLIIRIITKKVDIKQKFPKIGCIDFVKIMIKCNHFKTCVYSFYFNISKNEFGFSLIDMSGDLNGCFLKWAIVTNLSPHDDNSMCIDGDAIFCLIKSNVIEQVSEFTRKLRVLQYILNVNYNLSIYINLIS